MTRKIVLFIVLLSALGCYGQAPVMVAENTLKLGLKGEDFFYLGFAQGDQLIFNFEEANGKELNELEIVEMPATSRLLERKTRKIENKILIIQKTGIYKFRFTNTGIGARQCKYKIQRIPASPATQNFNTMVFTHNVYDTTYTTVEEDYLARVDTVLINFQDRTVKVNAISDPAGNKADFNFILPDNTIGWSYYITVNESGKQEYEEANKKITPHSRLKNYNILGALVMKAPVSIAKPATGEGVNYWIVMGVENSKLFATGAKFQFMKKAKANCDYARMEYRRGPLYFCFSNDNKTDPVSVTVKITSIHVNDIWEKRPVKRMVLAPRNEMYLKN